MLSDFVFGLDPVVSWDWDLSNVALDRKALTILAMMVEPPYLSRILRGLAASEVKALPDNNYYS